MENIIEKIKVNEIAKQVLFFLVSVGVVALFKIIGITNFTPLLALCILAGVMYGPVTGAAVGCIGIYTSFGFGPMAFVCWALPYIVIGLVAGLLKKKSKLQISVLFVVAFVAWWVVSNLGFALLFNSMNLTTVFGLMSLPYLCSSFGANLLALGVYFAGKKLTEKK